MPIDEIDFAVSCSTTVTDEFEMQLTKTGNKARNWMKMFHNWSTKDKIKRAFSHSRVSGTKLKTHFFFFFFFFNEEVTKMGGKTYIWNGRIHMSWTLISFIFVTCISTNDVWGYFVVNFAGFQTRSLRASVRVVLAGVLHAAVAELHWPHPRWLHPRAGASGQRGVHDGDVECERQGGRIHCLGLVSSDAMRRQCLFLISFFFFFFFFFKGGADGFSGQWGACDWVI